MLLRDCWCTFQPCCARSKVASTRLRCSILYIKSLRDFNRVKSYLYYHIIVPEVVSCNWFTTHKKATDYLFEYDSLLGEVTSFIAWYVFIALLSYCKSKYLSTCLKLAIVSDEQGYMCYVIYMRSVKKRILYERNVTDMWLRRTREGWLARVTAQNGYQSRQATYIIPWSGRAPQHALQRTDQPVPGIQFIPCLLLPRNSNKYITVMLSHVRATIFRLARLPFSLDYITFGTSLLFLRTCSVYLSDLTITAVLFYYSGASQNLA